MGPAAAALDEERPDWLEAVAKPAALRVVSLGWVEVYHGAKMRSHREGRPGRPQRQPRQQQDEAALPAKPATDIGPFGCPRLRPAAHYRRGNTYDRAQGGYRRLPARHPRPEAVA